MCEIACPHRKYVWDVILCGTIVSLSLCSDSQHSSNNEKVTWYRPLPFWVMNNWIHFGQRRKSLNILKVKSTNFYWIFFKWSISKLVNFEWKTWKLCSILIEKLIFWIAIETMYYWLSPFFSSLSIFLTPRFFICDCSCIALVLAHSSSLILSCPPPTVTSSILWCLHFMSFFSPLPVSTFYRFLFPPCMLARTHLHATKDFSATHYVSYARAWIATVCIEQVNHTSVTCFLSIALSKRSMIHWPCGEAFPFLGSVPPTRRS